MALVTSARLRGVTSLREALGLFADLDFAGAAKPVDVRALSLPGVVTGSVIKAGTTKRTGYAVAVLEAREAPRALRPLARALQREVHDRPLGVVGITGPDGRWLRMIVFRPRRVGGQLGAVTVARLDVDLAHATGHDCQVLSSLQWRKGAADAVAHDALDSALDVEEVTKRFYKGLVPHFNALDRAVQAAAAKNLIVGERIEGAGGSRRVAIRLLTQVLFCYFLQRKGLFAGDREYLSRAFTGRGGAYYPTVLEPLFYEALAVPEAARSGTMSLSGVPFLNGGLFERRYGDVSLDLPDELFSLDAGLLSYLDHWTFTAAEETADESEVAVDPEMLGRIFESLLPEFEREQKGTYYTPRPVVQFMCREALVARLAAGDMDQERLIRTLVTDEDPLTTLDTGEGGAELQRHLRDLDGDLASLTVLDPAVGSGAFLLGMMGEIVRLRSIAHEAVHSRQPTQEQVHAWKLHAIERSLFGVDIEPTAIELCRLRLWLTLAVELDPARPVPPLPNLEYRTVTADSLVDFVEGIPIQDTRRHEQIVGQGLFGELSADTVVRLRADYFNAADPKEKTRLRGQLLDAEDSLLGEWLEGAKDQLRRNAGAGARLDALKAQLRSPDRVYPVFMPGFSAPDVWSDGGWDVVIMNPPYVGRKEIPQRYGPETIDALERHYGGTHDLMILFAERALQLVRPGGVISMIFNDSIFTSSDGDEYRRGLFARATVTAIARTKCFEGQVVNGGVIVARAGDPAAQPLRWVEGYRRPTADFAGASANLDGKLSRGAFMEAGRMEVFTTARSEYLVLPHRPLFRPSVAALDLQQRFTRTAEWATFSQWPKTDGRSAERAGGWTLLSNTSALDLAVAERQQNGFYDRLAPGQYVMLGLVTEGGQGLATADDRRFLGAIEGTDAAAEHLDFQARLERLTSESRFAEEYKNLLRTHGDREAALLALWAVHGAKRPCPLPWPRTGTFRIAPKDLVRTQAPNAHERREGFAAPNCWVPFEKGDQSQELENAEGKTSRIGAAWDRENPLVVDWSAESVALLRRRAAAKGAQSPRLQNEALWFSSGVTWNVVASYLRVRRVPEGAVFGHKAPLVRPLSWVRWLTPLALLALLNAPVLDFIVRTFLGSRMMIEVGDLRRLPIPVLSPDQTANLETLAERAIAAKGAADNDQRGEELTAVEKDVDEYVRDLYGIDRGAELWVVR